MTLFTRFYVYLRNLNIFEGKKFFAVVLFFAGLFYQVYFY